MAFETEALKSVLFVSHTADPGGAELAIARYLGAKGQSAPRILFLEPGPVAQQVEGAIVAPGGLPIWSKVRVINETVRRLQPALVVSNTMRAAVLVGTSKVPTSAHAYYLRDLLSADHLSWTKSCTIRSFMRLRVGAVITNSVSTRDSIPISRLRREAQIVVSCSGMTDDEVEFARQNRVVSSGHPVRLLSLSRIAEWKGQHVLLEALELLARRGVERSALTLTIAGAPFFGEDNYAEKVAQAAAESPFDVRLVGHQSDVAGLLDAHDVLVHTSLSPEPFGQVVVQGIAHGLGVIASAGGGPNNILRGNAGMLWDVENVRSLADCIEQMLDPAIRKQYVDRGFGRAFEYTDNKAIDSLDSALISCLDKCRSLDNK